MDNDFYLFSDEENSYESDKFKFIADSFYFEDGKSLNVDSYWDKGWVTCSYAFERKNVITHRGKKVAVFPVRCRLLKVVFNKSLRRVLSRNTDLKFVIRPFVVTPRKNALFSRHFARFKTYSPRRICDGNEIIQKYPSQVKEVCVFKNRKLIALSVFEVGEKSIYSRLACWDLSEHRRSLGTFTALLEMKYALKKKKDFYYLGDFFKEHSRLNYKLRFPAVELYDWKNDVWVEYKKPSL